MEEKMFLAAIDENNRFRKWYLSDGEKPKFLECKENWSGVDVDSYKIDEENFSYDITTKEAAQLKMFNSYKKVSPTVFAKWLGEFSKSKSDLSQDGTNLAKCEKDMEKKIAAVRAISIARIKNSKNK